MLRERIRRLTDKRLRAEKRLNGIHDSVRTLDDEDLLDLADIFKGVPDSPLSKIAVAEMTRRNIGL